MNVDASAGFVRPGVIPHRQGSEQLPLFCIRSTISWCASSGENVGRGVMLGVWVGVRVGVFVTVGVALGVWVGET